MADGKIIRCCYQCGYYDKQRHYCHLGHKREDNPKDHFYDDCTSLEDLAEHDKKVKADAIDEYNEALKECLLSIGDIDCEDIDYVARKLKEKNK